MNSQKKAVYVVAAVVALCANGSAWAGKSSSGDTAVKQLQHVVKSISEDNENLRRQTQSLQQGLKEFKKQSDIRQQRNSELQQQIDGLKNELKQARLEVKYSQKGQRAVSSENKTLWQRVHDANDLHNQLQTKNSNLRNENSSLKVKLEEAKGKNGSLQSQNSDLQLQNTNLQNSNDENSKQLQNVNDALRDAKQQLQQAENDRTQLQAKLELEQNKNTFMFAANAVTNTIAGKLTYGKTLRAELHSVSNDVAKLQFGANTDGLKNLWNKLTSKKEWKRLKKNNASDVENLEQAAQALGLTADIE